MKRIFLFAALSFSFLCANAQGPSFGLKAGPQIATITDVNDGKSIFRYHIGAFAQMPLADRLKGQAELLFSAQGLRDTETDYLKQHNNYLMLPVTAKYQIWKGLSAHAGLQVGYLLSAKFKDTEDGFDYGNKEDYHKVELGILLGAEYLVVPHVTLGMRMNWGMTEVFKDYEGYKQRVFQMFVAYNISGGDF